MQVQQGKHINKLEKSNIYGPVATDFDGSNTGSWRLSRPKVNYLKCIKCETCAMYCPTNVIDIKKDIEACVIIDWYYCKGCGICANVCPTKCIEMEKEGGEV